jgi:sulfotransferase 6B1
MDINGSLARRLKRNRLLRPVAIAAYRAWTPLTHRSGAPRLVVNSMPKAGTHLLMSLLDALPHYRFSGRHFSLSVLDLQGEALDRRLAALRTELRRTPRGTYITGHLAYEDRAAEEIASSGFKVANVVRDPRALVVSTAHYMRTYPRHPLYETVNRRFPTTEQLIEGVILGFPQDDGPRHWRPMSEHLKAFVPWTESDTYLTLRFEDLVGSMGGGLRESQIAAISSLTSYLEIPLADDELNMAADSAFDPRSATFRSGAIDSWKKDLGQTNLAILRNECGQVAKSLGYDLG